MPLLPPPLRYATVLCFAASVRLACRPRTRWSKQSDRWIANVERQVTIIPLTIGPIVGWSLVSILGSGEIPFPWSRKKDRDSRVSLTSLNKTKTINTVYYVIKNHSETANTLCDFRNVTLLLKPQIRHVTSHNPVTGFHITVTNFATKRF